MFSAQFKFYLFFKNGQFKQNLYILAWITLPSKKKVKVFCLLGGRIANE